MSIYCVSIGRREYQVQITDTHTLLDGEPVPCDLTSLNDNGMHQLSRDNQSREVYLASRPSGVYEAYVAGRRIVARVDPANRRRRPAAPGAGEIVAPMPGLIVEFLVREGDIVEAGQPVVVEESMKMQMQLRAESAGRVTRVIGRPGKQVEKGAVLVKIAPHTGA